MDAEHARGTGAQLEVTRRLEVAILHDMLARGEWDRARQYADDYPHLVHVYRRHAPPQRGTPDGEDDGAEGACPDIYRGQCEQQSSYLPPPPLGPCRLP
jgi:hypothetical protein